MPWSGGSVSFSGGPNTFSVSYSAPSYTPPAGYSVTGGPYVTSAGPGSVSCGSSASQTYQVEIFRSSPPSTQYENYTISGTAPACPPPPPPPPDTSGRMYVFNGSTWVKGPVSVYNGSTWVQGPVYVYNGSAWVKSV